VLCSNFLNMDVVIPMLECNGQCAIPTLSIISYTNRNFSVLLKKQQIQFLFCKSSCFILKFLAKRLEYYFSSVKTAVVF
jgi:hypothetical protein